MDVCSPFPELRIEEIEKTRDRLDGKITVTPSVRWTGKQIEDRLGDTGIEVYVKLELFQRTGTFKARGALNNILHLSDNQLSRGVVTCSAGNHAVACSYAAAEVGTSAKVVMTNTANTFRKDLAGQHGGKLILVDDPKKLFPTAQGIAEDEGRTFIHPFDSVYTMQGTATAGLELTTQVPQLDVVFLPIGGGGLCGGVSAAVKQVWPNCRIIGVEPDGARTMYDSFAKGEAVHADSISTIADSLAPPMATPFAYAVNRAFLDKIVLVSDDEILDAMRLIFRGLKCAVEPAAAATTAALLRYKDEHKGKKVGIILCGSNIDIDDYMEKVQP
eukprot:CFRG2452T1